MEPDNYEYLQSRVRELTRDLNFANDRVASCKERVSELKARIVYLEGKKDIFPKPYYGRSEDS